MAPLLARPGGQLLGTLKAHLSNKAALCHERTPLLRKLPPSVVYIILTIAVVNVAVWVAVGIVLVIISLSQFNS